MRTALLLALALLSTPLAAAGIDAGIDLDEGRSTCSSSEATYSTSDEFEIVNESYTYRSYQYQSSSEESDECRSEHTSVGVWARDDAGQLFWVGSHDESASRTSEGSYDNGSGATFLSHPDGNYSEQWRSGEFQYGRSDAQDDSWARETGAHVLDARAAYVSGCSESSEASSDGTGRYSASDYGDSRSTNYDAEWVGEYESTDACRTGVETGVGPRDAFVGRKNGCAYSHESRSAMSSASYSSSYEWWDGRGVHDGESHCRYAVVAEAMGAELVAAGNRDDCVHTGSYEWGGATYDNTTSSYAGDELESRCTNGVFVTGPTGLDVFVGTDSTWHQSCMQSGEEWECTDSETSQSFAQATWAASPLGPGNIFYAALP